MVFRTAGCDRYSRNWPQIDPRNWPQIDLLGLHRTINASGETHSQPRHSRTQAGGRSSAAWCWPPGWPGAHPCGSLPSGSDSASRFRPARCCKAQLLVSHSRPTAGPASMIRCVQAPPGRQRTRAAAAAECMHVCVCVWVYSLRVRVCVCVYSLRAMGLLRVREGRPGTGRAVRAVRAGHRDHQRLAVREPCTTIRALSRQRTQNTPSSSAVLDCLNDSRLKQLLGVVASILGENVRVDSCLCARVSCCGKGSNNGLHR